MYLLITKWMFRTSIYAILHGTFRTTCFNWRINVFPLRLDTDPEIFYGFWGMCFNDYRNTLPHEGYHIIKRWKEKYFHRDASPIAKALHNYLEENRKDKQEEKEEEENEKEKEEPEEGKKEVENEKEKEGSESEKEEAKPGEEKKEVEQKQTQAPLKSYSAVRPDLPAAGPFFIYTSNVSQPFLLCYFVLIFFKILFEG